MIVGAGYTGLWAARHALADDPGRDVARARRRDRGGRRLGAQRRLPVRLDHPRRRQRAHPLPRRAGHAASGWATRTTTPWSPTWARSASTPPSSPWARSTSPSPRGRPTSCPSTPTCSGSSARRSSCSTPTRCGPRWTPPPSSAACGPAATSGSSTPPGWRGGCWPRCSGPGRGCTSTPRSRRSRTTGDTVVLRGPHLHVRARRVLLATNAFPGLVAPIRRAVVPVYDHVLVTEPLSDEQWAAVGWRGRPGPVGRREPVPLLPAHARRADPLGRMGRPLPLREPGRPPARTGRAHVADPGRALPGHLPPTRRHALHPPLGRADRHDVAVHVHRRHPPRRARWRGRSGTPAWAWGRAGSALGWRSTCWPAGRHRAHPAGGRAQARRSRSRPSRCGGPRCRPPAGPSPAPTPTTAAAARGCACSTASASGSILRLRPAGALGARAKSPRVGCGVRSTRRPRDLGPAPADQRRDTGPPAPAPRAPAGSLRDGPPSGGAARGTGGNQGGISRRRCPSRRRRPRHRARARTDRPASSRGAGSRSAAISPSCSSIWNTNTAVSSGPELVGVQDELRRVAGSRRRPGEELLAPRFLHPSGRPGQVAAEAAVEEVDDGGHAEVVEASLQVLGVLALVDGDEDRTVVGAHGGVGAGAVAAAADHE